VAYDCDKPRCLRRVSADASAPPTGGGETMLARLQNGTPQDPVFSYSPTGALPPTHMEVKVRVPAAGERSGSYQSSVVLDDGLALRNVNLGG